MYGSRYVFSVPCLLHRVSVGKRVNSVTRILEYLMVPTEEKLLVDPRPYFSKGFDVPQVVLDRAATAHQSLWKQPATADEVLLKNLTG